MPAPASARRRSTFILEALPGRHFMVVLRRRRVRRLGLRLVRILLGRLLQRDLQKLRRARSVGRVLLHVRGR